VDSWRGWENGGLKWGNSICEDFASGQPLDETERLGVFGGRRSY